MLTLYILCFVVGGIFVALAALAGLDGVDFDSDFDPDVELRDPSSSANTPVRHRSSPPFRLPLFNLRFWTFGGCFFGLTGILLSGLTPMLSPIWTAVLAMAVGLFSGTGMVWTLQLLRQQQADSLVRSEDLLGLIGVVELPFDRHSPGKIRIAVKGSTIDFVALTTDETPFNLGDQAVVVGRENNKVWVVSKQAFGQIID